MYLCVYYVASAFGRIAAANNNQEGEFRCCFIPSDSCWRMVLLREKLATIIFEYFNISRSQQQRAEQRKNNLGKFDKNTKTKRKKQKEQKKQQQHHIPGILLLLLLLLAVRRTTSYCTPVLYKQKMYLSYVNTCMYSSSI